MKQIKWWQFIGKVIMDPQEAFDTFNTLRWLAHALCVHGGAKSAPDSTQIMSLD